MTIRKLSCCFIIYVSLIEEKVDILAPVRNRIWSETVDRIEEKRDE